MIRLGLVGGGSFRGDAGLSVSALLYWLDSIVLIVLAGLYRLDCIYIGLRFANRNWILCYGWFATGWMVRMDWMKRWWDGGEMVGPTISGTGTVAPLLAPERERCHWLLRSSGLWEAVDGTNRFGAARARIICVGSKKYYK